jgi:GNAT superfamily N-acetyltransferase
MEQSEMERLAMFVQLTNLLARVPNDEDSYAIAELVTTCDIAEHGNAGSTMDDLQRSWRCYSFHLSDDAWVIVTHKGQFAGFGCVWHRDSEEFSTFVCVHPDYRKRGIGTLLLRLVEDRARRQMRLARPEVRVSLKALVSSSNSEARSLFEREGYSCIRDFWRVTLELDEASRGIRDGKFVVDVDVESRRLVGASTLYDREGIYSVWQYSVYEKELRPGQDLCLELDEESFSLVMNS